VITIDKTDALYKYLHGLGVIDIEKEYQELASLGRYKKQDVFQYWYETFRPSATEEVDEQELVKILDYYTDLKHIKKIGTSDLKPMLKEYLETKADKIKDKIISSQLKDVLYMCVNYCSLHKDADIQDVIQIANIGLLEALNNYNIDAKIDFKDYILYYVRKNIIEEYGEKNNG